jgi:tetratricopeptide (TPR) repeat protein
MSLLVQLLIEVGPRHTNRGVITTEPTACSLELGANWLRYREGKGYEVTLDFASRRCILFDADTGQVDDNSLLTTLGHRVASLGKRAGIAGVLDAGGASGHGFGAVFLEHQLAIVHPAGHTTMTPIRSTAPAGFSAMIKNVFSRRPTFDIEVATRGSEITYSHAGQVLVAHSERATDAAPEYVWAFAQFVRYRFGGHPLVLNRLASQQRIPEALRLRALSPMSFDDGAVSIRVTDTRETAHEPPSRDGIPAIFDQHLAIHAILLEEYSRNFRDDRPSADVRLAEASNLAHEGRILEALLAFFALSLEQPVSVPPALAGAVKSSTDPRVATLVSQPRNADEALARADALAALRAELDTHPDTLLAMEAATRVSLNEGQRAEQLYVEALKLNPLLLGAYRDLGYYYLGYRPDLAWRCWDAARRIAPSHPMLRDVDEYEQRLVADHPEYFASTV